MRNLVFVIFLVLALVSCAKAPTVVFTFRDVFALATFGVVVSAVLIYVLILWIKDILKWIEKKTRRETGNPEDF